MYNQFPDNEKEYEDIDLLQLLKEREHDKHNLALLDERYTDILLIFDLDPQAPDFSPEKIRSIANYFTESTNMGKLYLNYPMVESFYHMKDIPDDGFNSYIVVFDILQTKKYKQYVHEICRNGDYNKFAVKKKECSCVIKQNLEKAKAITQTEADISETVDILENQLSLLNVTVVFRSCVLVFFTLQNII